MSKSKLTRSDTLINTLVDAGIAAIRGAHIEVSKRIRYNPKRALSPRLIGTKALLHVDDLAESDAEITLHSRSGLDETKLYVIRLLDASQIIVGVLRSLI